MSDESKLSKDYEAAKNGSKAFRDHWDDMLEMAYAKINPAVAKKSNIKDGSLATIIYERACRVAAQPATGRIVPLTRHDEGKSQIINLVWNRYCIPRMNWQYPFMTKLRLWEFYSLVYGMMPMVHGYHVDDNYVGPDCRLVDPRFVFPQAGRLSPNDCDKVYVEMFYSVHTLKSRMGKEGWDKGAIKEVLESCSSDSSPTTTDQTTNLQEARGENEDLYKGQIKIVTEYVRGYGKPWRSFAPDYGNKIVREVPNHFKSGRIPVVFKYAMPTIDSFWGLGDIERGESLQRAIDSTLNIAMSYMQMMLFPPTMYTDGLNISQYKMKPGAKWKIPKDEAIKPLEMSNMPPQIQQQTYQHFKGALLNQNGTTDTQISGSDKLPGYGKTPDALKQLEQRENARDSWDREMLEAAQTELYEGMIEEMGSRHDTPIDFNIFDEEIKQIAEAGFGDMLEISDSAIEHYVDPETGLKIDAPDELQIKKDGLLPKLRDTGTAKITVDAETLRGKYLFNVDIGSTMANDEAEEFERLNALVEALGTPTMQQGVEQLKAEGREVDLGAITEQYIKSSNLKGSDKFIRDVPLSKQEDEVDDIDEETAQSDGEMFNPEMIQTPELQQLVSSGGIANG